MGTGAALDRTWRVTSATTVGPRSPRRGGSAGRVRRRRNKGSQPPSRDAIVGVELVEQLVAAGDAPAVRGARPAARDNGATMLPVMELPQYREVHDHGRRRGPAQDRLRSAAVDRPARGRARPPGHTLAGGLTVDRVGRLQSDVARVVDHDGVDLARVGVLGFIAVWLVAAVVDERGRCRGCAAGCGFGSGPRCRWRHRCRRRGSPPVRFRLLRVQGETPRPVGASRVDQRSAAQSALVPVSSELIDSASRRGSRPEDLHREDALRPVPQRRTSKSWPPPRRRRFRAWRRPRS
jgi:hypothetical protein